MKAGHGQAGDRAARDEARGASDALPETLEGALEHGRALLKRLRRISEHSPGRDRYRVLEEIGRGGMGRVLRVWDEDLQRELAMKEISFAPDEDPPADESGRERMLARFILEARITSRLDHPGIVPVHEIAIGQSGVLYFTMPLVRGRNLQQVFDLARREQEGWNDHRALGVLLKVAHTVAYAHSRGVIHRDLKPSNVMVGPYGEAYVMDWGLALVRGREESGVVVGTPAYMAPEQATTGEVNERSDVYALGAMLYELLCGRMPHEATLAEGAGGQGLDLGVPRPVLELADDAPPELVAICNRAMAARPKDRYRSAMELADDIQAWIERRVVTAYATGRWARVKKWRERNPRLSLALEALLLLALLSVSTVYALQRSKLTAVAAERAEVERKGYARSLKAAELSLAQGGRGEAAEFLEACPAPLRGWVWRHLAFLADPSRLRLEGHGETVLAVAVRPDDERVATGSRDGLVRLWDPRSGTLIARMEGHLEAVSAVAFSPDDALLASGSLDHTIRLWDATSGASSRRLGDHARGVASLAFSPDGKRLVAGDFGGVVCAWDLDGGFAWQWNRYSDGVRRPNVQVSDVLWRDERVVLAALTDGKLARLDAATGEELGALSIGAGIYDLDYRPRDDRLAAATLEGVVFLTGSTLEQLGALRDSGPGVRSLAFTPDGGRLGLGMSDGSVRVWDESREETTVLHGHRGAVLALASDASGQHMLSGSEDRTARLWDSEAAAVRTFTLGGGETFLQARLHLAPDVAVAARGRAPFLARFGARTDELDLGQVESSAVAMHPRGESLAVGTRDGYIRLHDALDGRLLREFRASTGELLSLRFDETGTRLISRGTDLVMRLWDVERERALLELPDPENDETGAFALHPDGELLLFGLRDGRIRMVDPTRGALLGFLEAHASSVRSFAFARGGALLASGDAAGTIVVWDLERRRVLATMKGHKRDVSALFFDEHDDRLFSASLDGTVRVWEPLRGELLITLRCGVWGVTDLAFDPEGDRLAAVDALNRVFLWSTHVPD